VAKTELYPYFSSQIYVAIDNKAGCNPQLVEISLRDILTLFLTVINPPGKPELLSRTPIGLASTTISLLFPLWRQYHQFPHLISNTLISLLPTALGIDSPVPREYAHQHTRA
jgi:hypothetical protein